MADTETNKSGLSHSIRNLASSLLAMGQTRLELLALDVEEERLKFFSLLVWTFITMFCAAMTLVLAAILIVVIYWDSNRYSALAILIAVFLLVTIIALRAVYNLLKNKPKMFSASIAELTKDREKLSTRDE